jgi:thioredoxin-like negative regulator of GroEL
MADMHLMLVDGKVVQVDMGPVIARHRAEVAGLRADAIDQAAALFDEAFTTDEIRDMWRASGLSGDDLDSASNVALVLWQVEQRELALRWQVSGLG